MNQCGNLLRLRLKDEDFSPRSGTTSNKTVQNPPEVLDDSSAEAGQNRKSAVCQSVTAPLPPWCTCGLTPCCVG